MKFEQAPRRRFLKIAGLTLMAIPLLAGHEGANATTNAALRSALKYQDKPSGDKSCANCPHFIPGPDAKGPGTCKVIPGDTEISPQGYCNAWVKKS